MTKNTDEAQTCSKCGVTIDRDDRFADPQCTECVARHNARIRRWHAADVSRAGVAARHLKFLKWAELQGPPAYLAAVASVRRFCAAGDSVLIVTGPRGSGKSQVAAVAVSEAIRCDHKVRYLTALVLLSDLKRRYEPGLGGAAAWMDSWMMPQLLVIDEVGERCDSDHDRVMLTGLVDKRYAACRPTVLCGNVPPDRIVDVLGASIADRANEGGGIVNFTGWPSWRGAVAANGK